MVSQYPFVMYRSQGRTLLARLSPGGAGSASWHYTLAQESPSALQGRPPPVFQHTPTTLPRQPKAPSLQSPRSHQSRGGSSLYPLLDCDDIITILLSEELILPTQPSWLFTLLSHYSRNPDKFWVYFCPRVGSQDWDEYRASRDKTPNDREEWEGGLIVSKWRFSRGWASI